MNQVTIYVLLTSYVQFNYDLSKHTIDSIRQDIITNDYFGSDTKLVLSELKYVMENI